MTSLLCKTKSRYRLTSGSKARSRFSSTALGYLRFLGWQGGVGSSGGLKRWLLTPSAGNGYSARHSRAR